VGGWFFLVVERGGGSCWRSGEVGVLLVGEGRGVIKGGSGFFCIVMGC